MIVQFKQVNLLNCILCSTLNLFAVDYFAYLVSVKGINSSKLGPILAILCIKIGS